MTTVLLLLAGAALGVGIFVLLMAADQPHQQRTGEGRMQPPRRSRGISIPWITIAIALATLVGAWMFRYETFNDIMHRNRFTGAICMIDQECWRGTLPLDLAKDPADRP